MPGIHSPCPRAAPATPTPGARGSPAFFIIARKTLNETFPQPLDFAFSLWHNEAELERNVPSACSVSHRQPCWGVLFPARCWGLIINNRRGKGNSATLLLLFGLGRIAAHLSRGILGDDCSLRNTAAISASLPAPPADISHSNL